MEDNDDVVCKFRPQVRVFPNTGCGVSIEVMDANGQADIVSIPLGCAKTVSKAIIAAARELS